MLEVEIITVGVLEGGVRRAGVAPLQERAYFQTPECIFPCMARCGAGMRYSVICTIIYNLYKIYYRFSYFIVCHLYVTYCRYIFYCT